MVAWMVEHLVEKMVVRMVASMVALSEFPMADLLVGQKVDSMAESWVVR